jgi:hypothetical protein
VAPSKISLTLEAAMMNKFLPTSQSKLSLVLISFTSATKSIATSNQPTSSSTSMAMSRSLILGSFGKLILRLTRQSWQGQGQEDQGQGQGQVQEESSIQRSNSKM